MMGFTIRVNSCRRVCFFLAVVLSLSALNCSQNSTGPGNSAPVIRSLTPSKSIVTFLEKISIRADVEDADGDSLSFLWNADKGNFSFTSLDSAVWNAPDSAGTARIQLRVSDAFSASAFDSIRIVIQNQLPVISSLSASKTNVLVGNLVTLTADVSDPDGGLVSLEWKATGGNFIGSTTEKEATWRASTTVSNVIITLTATDSDNGVSEKSVTITVFQELGSVWIADTFNDAVVKIASNGSELLRNADFKQPQGLAVDISDRTLWIADRGNNRIVKFSDSGDKLLEITGIDRPTAIAVEADGNVWVTSMADTVQVIKISHDGTIMRRVRGFSDPQAVDVNRSNGDVWVADTGNDRIVRLDSRVPDGYDLDSIDVVIERFDAQFSGFKEPEALDVNQETGDCWIADTGKHRIVQINGLSQSLFIIGGFFSPLGIAVNKLDGSVWVTNTGENEVVKIFPDIFTLPSRLPESYNIDDDAGFHFTIPGYIQPRAVDINVVDNIVWFTDNFRVVKIRDLGTEYTLIQEFTNYNAPKSLKVNPGIN